MANGLPNPKDLLNANLAGVRSLEGALPSGFPKLSGVLGTGIQSLPDLPAMPAMAAGLKVPSTPAITNFVQSVETVLPQGVPKVSSVLSGNGGARKESTAKQPDSNKRILSGGYRLE